MRRAMLALAVAALGACTDQARNDEDAGQEPATDVERAVAVHHGIEAAPGAADSVLTAHGLTPAGLDSLMYRIAADSASAAEYTRAIR